MPQIRLEDTLNDFFEAEDSRTNTISPRKFFVSYNPISDLDLASDIPRNIKYMIQQWRTSSENHLSVIVNLILMPQRMAWIAGKMPVVFFEGLIQEDKRGHDGLYGSVETDLKETIEHIHPSSRFEAAFCTSPVQLAEFIDTDAVIIPYLPSDSIAHLPHLNDPDVHYELLSKRALALSELPTPTARVVDFNGPPHTGWDDSTLDVEVARAMGEIHGRRVPFVLKANSAGGSMGTYIVRTAEEHMAAARDVHIFLRRDLQNLGQENAHRHPCSLILTDVLPGPAVALNFYVQGDGHARFSSCCEQTFSKTDHWHGGAITYSAQGGLAAHYAAVVQQAAAFFHSRGYRGPVGMDVMTDEAGAHKIVDLNPRPTGTFVLGCLRNHFKETLDLDEACVLPFMEFTASREVFRTTFGKELQAGEIIALAWCSDHRSSRCHCCLAVGSKDKPSLERRCKGIMEWVQAMQA